jgi:TPR repeat protein
VIALLFCAPVCADLFSAQTAYQKGDFDKALHEFRELAQIGQPIAQLDLAIMYARGEGARQSDIYAYAWASVAAANGLEKAKALADRLRPNLAPGSEKIAADIQAQFGNARLDAHLNPRIVEDAEREDRSRCRPLKAYLPEYPPDAARLGIQGKVYTEFSLMPDGRSRNPRIIYAVPEGEFEAAVRESLLHSDFAKGSPGDPPVQCTLFYNFEMRAASVQYPRLDVFVSQTRSKAEAGDPSAQMLYGMLLVGLPQLHESRSHALPWFLKAAQAGVPSAQYQVGFSLLKGWGCNCETDKGLDWLRRAAQQGQADAEVTLAMYALKGHPDDERAKQARLWLEQAAASGSHDGKLYLSALLATAPPDGGGDPERALQLLEQVSRDVKGDPIAFEIRAAAQASGGDFAAALRSENKAIEVAQHLKWDLTPLNERLAKYTARQPWREPLLDL